ncbi:MAG TPA: hypothetical protein VGR47_01010 [Terracidiphilus sp.]|nr:hypothetical protein [Terracidiphilus sp.]
MRLLRLAVFLPGLLLVLSRRSAAQSAASAIQAAFLPDAPQAQPQPPPIPTPSLGPCELRDAGAAVASAASIRALDAAGVPQPAPPPIKPAPCPPYVPVINWYARFLNGPQVKPLTAKEKGWLAIRNLGDPFNFVTIAGNSAIYIGSDSHTPYGPGVAGLFSNIGVTYSEDATGEFFGTFAIPSIAHQDPHYHRMPNASIPRRFLHTIVQIAWTQGDNGRNMINYADIVGFAIDDEIANLYVPGEQTDLPATAARYATGLATAPIDNLITEFLPDVASRIHVRIVLVQRIINQVAKTDGGGSD